MRGAAGAIARKLLATQLGVERLAWVSSVHEIEAKIDANAVTLTAVEANPVRCPDPAAAAEMERVIDAARRRGDSLGGAVECVARRVPVGLGASRCLSLPGRTCHEANSRTRILLVLMLSQPACGGLARS